MRIGLDLRDVPNAADRLALAVEADQLGLWAVLIGGVEGQEATEAAIVATATDTVHLALWLESTAAHPLTLAEEIAVLDHLSERRALAVVDGDTTTVDHVSRLLTGHIVEGAALSPPPAQTQVPVWSVREVRHVTLTGDLGADRATIDTIRDGGCTHLFVTWPGPLPVLARHLVTRAITPNFPQMVADMADVIEP